MNLRNFIQVSIFLFTCTIIHAQNIDSDKSKIQFKISNFGINTVNGTFNGMQGEIHSESNNITNIQVCIDASTIDTGNKKRDKHLKTDDFFAIDKYPQICFHSKNITQNGQDISVEGELYLHGVKKDTTIKLQYDINKKMLSGQFELNRMDFDLGPNSTFMVGKMVTIEVQCKLLD